MIENQFRDKLILEIISVYKASSRFSSRGTVSQVYASCIIHHYCHLHNSRNYTQRKCPDCHLMPSLCQTTERDCHTAWHDKSFSTIKQFGMSIKVQGVVFMKLWSHQILVVGVGVDVPKEVVIAQSAGKITKIVVKMVHLTYKTRPLHCCNFFF